MANTFVLTYTFQATNKTAAQLAAAVAALDRDDTTLVTDCGFVVTGDATGVTVDPFVARVVQYQAGAGCPFVDPTGKDILKNFHTLAWSRKLSTPCTQSLGVI